MARCPDRRLSSVLGLDLTQDGFHVNLHGGFRDVVFTRDDLVRVAIHQAAQDNRLTDGQALCRRAQLLRSFLGRCLPALFDAGVLLAQEVNDRTGEDGLPQENEIQRFDEHLIGYGLLEVGICS